MMKQETQKEKEDKLKADELTEEIDTPQGIVNFLQKRHGVFNFSPQPKRYSVTELVGCQRKSFYKQSGVEQEEFQKKFREIISQEDQTTTAQSYEDIREIVRVEMINQIIFK